MKKIAAIAGVVIAVVLIAICGINWMSQKAEPIDLSTVTGSPEFYELQWGMGTEEADKLIKISHQTIYGLVTETEVENGFIYTENEFKIYGLKCEKAYVNFSGDSLTSVMLLFPKGENSEVSLDDVTTKYIEAYGYTDTPYKWVGPETTIELIDAQISDQSDKYVVARYTRTVNSQFQSILNFNSGSDLDPFALSGKNNLFGKNAAMLVDGLMNGADYTVTKEEGAYTNYILYPSFEYMGVAAGDTGLELYSRDDGSGISKVSYLFFMDVEDIEGRETIIDGIYKEAVAAYGDADICTFTEFVLPDETPVDEPIGVEEFMSRMNENIEGIYHMTWLEGDMNVILYFAVNHYDDFTSAAVSFSKNVN